MNENESRDSALCFSAALAEELGEIHLLRGKRGISGAHLPPAITAMARHDPADAPSSDDPVKGARKAKKIFGAAHDMELVGLAFSGGGIRSATFNLGILQGLADRGLLRMFDYLSTVSGGGYIGGWLEAWILREGLQEARESKHHAHHERNDNPQTYGIDVVERELKAHRASRERALTGRQKEEEQIHTEPPPIRFLRQFSNYLTPRMGLLGADTWTAVAIYLRNLLLNQIVLTLFLFTLLLLPYIAVWATKGIPKLGLSAYWAPIMVFVFFLVAMILAMKNMGGLLDFKAPSDRPRKIWFAQRQGYVVATIAAPLLVALWILTGWLWNQEMSNNPLWRWILGGVLIFGLPWVVGSFWVPLDLSSRGHESIVELRYAKWFWRICPLLTGMVTGYLMWLVCRVIFTPMKSWTGGSYHELALGVPLTILVFLSVAAVNMGLMGQAFADPCREWWGRLAAWIVLFTLVWLSAFALSFYAPMGLIWLRGRAKTAGLAGLMWVISTAAGVMGGKSSKTGGVDSKTWKDKALSATPYVFIAGLASLLSLGLELILARLNWASLRPQTWGLFLGTNSAVAKTANWIFSLSGTLVSSNLTLTGNAVSPSPMAPSSPYASHWEIVGTVTNGYLLLWCLLAFVACLLMARQVDLNTFSMNMFYRNRLVRCYLGGSHLERVANPFIGFDVQDDLYLCCLRAGQNYSGPFPIFNATLNLVKTRHLAWQERKAAAFSMTPLRCGFDTWLEGLNLYADNTSHRRDEAVKSRDTLKSLIAWVHHQLPSILHRRLRSILHRRHNLERYGYRPTSRYAYDDGGFYLGTATSISGAALSPNMGYHSLSSLAILLTWFNVRTGFWAGNPRHKKTWTKPGPVIGIWRLLAEMFALTDDNAKYVYLSDGGHFENLGIYELVKRRCKYIVVCDAGEDADYTFADLGSAIRKCREDIGVEIEIRTKSIVPPDKTKGKFAKSHCVVGDIHYSDIGSDERDGVLVYLKATLTGDEPADVLEYHTSHDDFPHQTTGDQWFGESQFESYRRLGLHTIESLFQEDEQRSNQEGFCGRSFRDTLHSEGRIALFEALKKRWGIERGKEPANTPTSQEH